MTRETILQAIPDASYVPGGLDFPGWKRYRDIEEFVDDAAASSETFRLPTKPLPGVSRTLESVAARIASDDGFAARVFTRQTLGGDIEPIRKPTLIKLSRLALTD
jgi:hypothetical protein